MDVLCLTATPYIDDISVDYDGPPVPIGTRANGDEFGYSAFGGETSVYLSDAGFVSGPSDAPANTLFSARLTETFTIDALAFNGEEPAGRSRVSVSVLQAINADGALDYLTDYGWDGRSVKLYRVAKGAAFSAATLVFAGTAEGLDWDDRNLTIRLRDDQLLFDRPIQASVYSGGGDADGDSIIAGLRRPLVFGAATNCPLQLINAANLVYQVHDGQINAVTEVRDRGVALTATSDYADYAALVGATVAAGSYATCLALGLVRLGASSDGLITADVEGDAAGGYVSSTANIVRRIAATRMGTANVADPGGLDAASFTTLEAAQPASIGYYVGPEDDKTVAQVFDELMAGIGGFWGNTRAGLLFVKRLEAPSTPVATFTNADIIDVRPLRRTGPRPSKRRTVEYQHMFVVQDPDGLAAGLSASDREIYSSPARIAEASNSGVLAKHRLARDVHTVAFFASQSDAEAEATRLQALHGPGPDFYTAIVADGSFDYWLGDVVALDVDRYDLAGGRDFVVVGIREGGPSAELTLWG